jgi:chaperone modulatory protein CbpM
MGTGVKLVLRSRRGMDIGSVARQAGVRPELARAFFRQGLLEPPEATAAVVLARAVRLRRDLDLNYAGAALACELLARIDELEARLRRYEAPTDRPR